MKREFYVKKNHTTFFERGVKYLFFSLISNDFYCFTHIFILNGSMTIKLTIFNCILSSPFESDLLSSLMLSFVTNIRGSTGLR